MALVVNQPCCVTREELARALDVKAASYNNGQLDRQLIAATDSVEGLCQRVFYVTQATRQWDWPNFQGANPWRLYLDNWELAGQATAIVSGPYLSVPVVIPVNQVIFQPVNSGPPFRWIELRRDLNNAFGNNTTPQNDIQITGPFGFWQKTVAVGSLVSGINALVSTLQLSIGSGAGAGVGDVLMIDNESMIVQDANYVSVDTVVSGLVSNPPSKSDVSLGVVNGANYTTGETLIVGSEVVLIQFISGNTLTVQRAWDGSVLSPHNVGDTIYARRAFTVLRGQLGTAAATHSGSAPANIQMIPGLVKEYALAQALIGMIQEPGGYTLGSSSNPSRTSNSYGSTGRGQQREPIPGVGIADLERRLTNSKFYRKPMPRMI